MANRDSPIYITWKAMNKRCASVKYGKNYKMKGITVCEEWKDFKTFARDMGVKPSPLHTIDRINNKLGYSKDNCRWATKLEQSLNRRIAYECHAGHPWTTESTILTHNGKKETRRCKICFEAKKK